LFLCGSALCVVGIVGNSMNVVVMTRRRVRTALDDRMERSARVGLLSLTIADILPDHFRFRSVGRRNSVIEQGDSSLGDFYRDRLPTSTGDSSIDVSGRDDYRFRSASGRG